MDILLLSRVSGAAVALSGVIALSCSSSTGAENAPRAQAGFSRVAIEGRPTQESHYYLEESIFSCMRTEGFDYSRKPFAAGPEEVDSRALRAERGFGYADGEPGIVTEEETWHAAPENRPPSPAEIAELGRCTSKAHAALQDEASRYVESLHPAEREFYESVIGFEHHLMIEALDAWAQCMWKSGHHFSSPIEMYEAVTLMSEVEEVEVALADWDCSRTDTVYGKVEAAYAELDQRLNDGWTHQLRRNE